MKRFAPVGLRLLAVAAIGMVSAGCLVGSKVNETRTGKTIGSGTFEQVKAGETTSAWLKSALGEPTEKTKVDEHSEIWKWSYSKTQERDTWVFLLLVSEDKKTTTESVAVELRDGVVVRKWRDEVHP